MSGDDYPMGSVAVVRVSSHDSGRRAFRRDKGGWTLQGGGYVYNGDVFDVRPLVVLEMPNVAEVVTALRSYLPSGATEWDDEDKIVDFLAHTIEAQTKPPRIPEPGLWGVVEAGTDSVPMVRRWVRYGTCWRDAFGGHAAWDDLLEPDLIREGVDA